MVANHFTSKEEVFRAICICYAGSSSFRGIRDYFTTKYEAAEISQHLYELALEYVDDIEDVYELTETRLNLKRLAPKQEDEVDKWRENLKLWTIAHQRNSSLMLDNLGVKKYHAKNA